MDTTTRVVCVGSDVPQNVDGVFDEVVETLADCLAELESADCVVATDTIPDATCSELCSLVRSRRPDLPLVAFPSAGSEELAGEVIAAGVDGYVPQSQGLETLRSRLAALLSDSHSRSVGHSSRFELLVEQSPLAIIEWNRSFEAISWNPAATELFGYDRAEALGTSAFELVVGERDRTDVAAQWELLVGTDLEESSRSVTRNVRKDGTEVTCEWVTAPLLANGEVVRVLSFARDITDDLERANTLEALQETTRQLVGASSFETIAEITMSATGSVLDRSLAGVWFADEDGEALELAATASQLADASVDRSPVTPSDSLLWEVYERGEPMVVEDASIERFPYYLEFPLGNAIVYPLGAHGVLSVCSVGGRELETADMNLVRVLAATAEAALDRTARQRELERAKTIVEAVGDGVYATDGEGRFVTVNDTLASITGYDRETLVGDHFSSVLTAESADRVRDRVGALEPGTEDAATYEVTVLTESGERIPCESTTRLLCSGGDIEGSVGVVRDVSDRKRMERELRERRAKIENLHEVASRLDDRCRPEDVYELIVETAEDVLEFDVCVVDRAVGDSLVKVALSSHLDDADYVDRIPVETGIAGKTYRTGRTYRIDDVERCDDAAADAGAYASVLSAPIGDHGVFQAASRVPGAFDRHDEELVELLLSHVTDRLDQLESESVLRAERDRFAALFENVPDAVASVQHRDGEPIVEAVNPAFERTFGYDEAELIGESLHAYIVPFEDRDAAEAINRCSDEGSVVEAEVRRRTADGFREFMLRLVPIKLDDTESRSFALYTDVTEQKRRRKRLEILNRVLRHDLRNGMNVIGGCADLLADRVDGEAAARVETIRERANELTSLAEKSRTVERTLNRDGTDICPIDVAALAERATTRLENDDPNVEIERSISGPAPVSGGAHLETAFEQLLENAVEHHDGDPSIEVTVRDRPTEDLVALSVADDGPGIPPEERELLREEREITQLQHTNGLGLWLVNWAVSQSGGRLSIADNEPRGTVVTLELPRADPDGVDPMRD
ncbi:PAS domain S-box protein [Natronococcus sp. A-GB1]|uniref:PAS domain S-box protein n=1 Tax=Natronococcus sp. A-GB1 TaxID=3037648 RepID=UPI00241DC7F9|nr:PAS domain S-box protein [Natronococcus sp. A-GB1]MDG5758143.1 PAS domain S-box protein [Natronococcus sp. A-GB1]